MAAENRYTIRELAGMAATRKAAHGVAFVFGAGAVAVGKASDPSWIATVAMSDPIAPAVLLDYVVADDSGKVKRFSTVDALVKSVALISENNVGLYGVELDTGALFASKVPANIYKDAENKGIKLKKIRTAQVAKRAALDAMTDEGGPMFGWVNGNAAQVARYEETVAQSESIDRDVTALSVEIDRLQAIVESDPDYVGTP